MDAIAREVCQAYPETQGGFQLHPLGNAGGFSGARLWKVQTFCGTYCLRAWPMGWPSSDERLRVIHELMSDALDGGLNYVPRVMAPIAGGTWFEENVRLWELTTWLRGDADFHQHPTRTRLQSVMEAVARLHRVWRTKGLWGEVCFAVLKRLTRLTEWQHVHPILVEQAIDGMTDALLAGWAHRAWQQLRRWSRPALLVLESFSTRAVHCQFCHCDIWHNHVLFEGADVTGIVDYGSVRQDSVAVDLARVLGSLVGDDMVQRTAAIEAYEMIRPLSPEDRNLIDVLDHTGVVVGAGNWLRWLCLERRRFENTPGVISRLTELVTRMEAWCSNAQGPRPLGVEGIL